MTIFGSFATPNPDLLPCGYLADFGQIIRPPCSRRNRPRFAQSVSRSYHLNGAVFPVILGG